jgi:hypothetical protein
MHKFLREGVGTVDEDILLGTIQSLTVEVRGVEASVLI